MVYMDTVYKCSNEAMFNKSTLGVISVLHFKNVSFCKILKLKILHHVINENNVVEC